LWPLVVLEVTLTTADWVGLVPSSPTQVMVKVVVAEMAAEVAVPLAPTVPDHAPDGELEAVHELVFALDQFNVTVPPELTLVGVACSVAVAAGGASPTTSEYVPAPAFAAGWATKLMR
jgi:hypothetical protein